jgi:hypothetical protein
MRALLQTILAPFRFVERKLRDIRHHSREVEWDGFDLALARGFALFSILAAFAVALSERSIVRREREVIAYARVFRTLEDEAIRAAPIDAEARGNPWPTARVLADCELARTRVSRGWPLTSRVELGPVKIEVEPTPSSPATLVDRVREAATPVLTKSARDAGAPGPGTPAEKHLHVTAWIFSYGAWWAMLTSALWLVLLPLRIGTRLVRGTRNRIRQGRIDRCHCPSCGYDAKHSILRGRCPECGSELYERPERR